MKAERARRAARPRMRFVPVKLAERQAALLDHKVREFLVRQRIQVVNAIRAHLAEFGITIAKGIHNIDRLLATAEKVPEAVRPALVMLADPLHARSDRGGDRADRDRAERRSARSHDARGRGVPNRAGLCRVAGSHTQGAFPGRQERLGGISKAGNRYLRWLLYPGAMSRISALRQGAGTDWLGRMLRRKPVKVVAVALANRMARFVWAVISSGESYRADPA